MIWWIPFTLALWLSGLWVFQVSNWKILEVIFSRVEDHMPPVSLDDGWPLLTSRLQDFDNSSLLRSSKGLTFMHLFLDPTIVDPRCSNLMNRICTYPLHFLWSLGVDLTVTVVLPPEIFDLSDLEYFLSVQRSWPFILLQVFLLDLDYTSGKPKALSLMSCDLYLLFASSPELMLSLFAIISAFLIVSFLAVRKLSMLLFFPSILWMSSLLFFPLMTSTFFSWKTCQQIIQKIPLKQWL